MFATGGADVLPAVKGEQPTVHRSVSSVDGTLNTSLGSPVRGNILSDTCQDLVGFLCTRESGKSWRNKSAPVKP